MKNILVALVLVSVILGGCTQQPVDDAINDGTDGSMDDSTEDDSMGDSAMDNSMDDSIEGDAMEEMTPSVSVSAQEAGSGTVTIEEVIASENGWIVIHADSGESTPGMVIGQARVSEGTNSNVVVEIDPASATPMLFAMLHLDTGVEGEYEFPDADGPVPYNDKVVTTAFEATDIEAAPQEEQPAPREEPEGESQSDAATQEFYIESNDTGFYDGSGEKITSITVNSGEPAKITFFIRRQGTYYGGMTIRGPDFDSGKLDKEEEYLVEFTAQEDFEIKSYWPLTNNLKATLEVIVE